MGAFKFETILPPSGAGNTLNDLKTEILEKERNTSYAKGFKDGVNVTKGAVEVETNRLLSEIREGLSDICLTNEQASAAVMRSIEPLIETILAKLAPSTLREKLLEDVSARVQAVLKEHRGVRVEIEATAEICDQVSQMAAREGFEVDVRPNPELQDLEVRLNWGGGYDQLDLEKVRSDLANALNNYIACQDEEHHERRAEHE